MSPLTSWCLTHLHSNEACLSQHSSLDKSNIWSGIYCLDWILYKWKTEQMQFSWTLKCKYKDYTALFSKSLSVHCTVFWFPPHTSLHLKMGYFPCSEGVPLSAWVAVHYLCLPTMPQAHRWHGWRLTDGRHKFPTAKPEHFATCLPQHKGTFMQAKLSAGH